MPNGFANINGQNKQIKNGWANINGVMRKIKNGYVNINGVMKSNFNSFLPFFYIRHGSGALRKLDGNFNEIANVPVTGQSTVHALLDASYNQWVVPYISSNVSNQKITRVDENLNVLHETEVPSQTIGTSEAVCITRDGHLLMVPWESNSLSIYYAGGDRNNRLQTVTGRARDLRQMICDKDDNLFMIVHRETVTYLELRKYSGANYEQVKTVSSSSMTGQRSVLFNTRITGNATHIFTISATTSYLYGKGLRVSRYDRNLNGAVHYMIPIDDLYDNGSLAYINVTNDSQFMYISVNYNVTASLKKSVVIAIDYNGNEMWRHTINEKGNVAVAACRDGFLYYATKYHIETAGELSTIHKVTKSGEIVDTKTLTISNLRHFTIDPPLTTFPELW